MRLFRWLRDRFRPAEVPTGWRVQELKEWNRTFHDDSLEDTAVVIIVDPHLGPLDVIEPVRPLLFDKVRDLYPVDLGWRPGWLDWAAAA